MSLAERDHIISEITASILAKARIAAGYDISRVPIESQVLLRASTAFEEGCCAASRLSFWLESIAVLVLCSCIPTWSASHAEPCMCGRFHDPSAVSTEFSVHCHAGDNSARSAHFPLDSSSIVAESNEKFPCFQAWYICCLCYSAPGLSS